MLPIAFQMGFNVGLWFYVAFFVNLVTHAVVDHLKANTKVINLWGDQLIHLIQIIVTAIVLGVV